MQNDEISIIPTEGWCLTQLSNGRFLQHKAENARIIEIHFNCFIEETFSEDKEVYKANIHSLNFSDVYKIEVGNEFNTKILDREVKYKIEYIEKLSKGKYALITHLRNRSSIYLAPMLGGIKEQYLYKEFLINCYIDNTEDYLYLKYRFIPDADYLKFETEIKTHKLFINKKEQKEFVIYKFQVPEQYKNDIKLFKEGKYSKFSPALKKCIVDYHKLYYINEAKQRIIDPSNNIVAVLFRSKVLKEKLEKSLSNKESTVIIDDTLDLDSKPNLKYELL